MGFEYRLKVEEPHVCCDEMACWALLKPSRRRLRGPTEFCVRLDLLMVSQRLAHLNFQEAATTNPKEFSSP